MAYTKNPNQMVYVSIKGEVARGIPVDTLSSIEENNIGIDIQSLFLFNTPAMDGLGTHKCDSLIARLP